MARVDNNSSFEHNPEFPCSEEESEYNCLEIRLTFKESASIKIFYAS